jgi:hypothetical protein
MGKRMITYLLVLGAVGYLFLMYIYPALSGLLIFVLLYPAAGIVYLIFAGRGLSARVKRLSDYGEKEQQMKVSIQVCRESSLWIKVQDSAGNGTCSIRHQTKRQFMAF